MVSPGLFKGTLDNPKASPPPRTSGFSSHIFSKLLDNAKKLTPQQYLKESPIQYILPLPTARCRSLKLLYLETVILFPVVHSFPIPKTSINFILPVLILQAKKCPLLQGQGIHCQGQYLNTSEHSLGKLTSQA